MHDIVTVNHAAQGHRTDAHAQLNSISCYSIRQIKISVHEIFICACITLDFTCFNRLCKLSFPMGMGVPIGRALGIVPRPVGILLYPEPELDLILGILSLIFTSQSFVHVYHLLHTLKR